MTRTGIAVLMIVSAVSVFGSPELQNAGTVCTDCVPVVGDFNGDGLDDFFPSQTATDLYFNLGGRFGPPVIASGMNGDDMVVDVGDFNGDGLDDVIVMKVGRLTSRTTRSPDGPHRLLINAGSAHFRQAPNLPGYVVQVTDFDADGRADLVLAASDPVTKLLNGLTLMRGNGDDTFTFHQTLPFPDTKDSTTTPPFGVGDLNSDGRPDLVQQRGKYLHFYFAGADGQFSAPRSRYTFIDPQELHIADVNGDGHADVVFIAGFYVSPSSHDVRVTALFGDGTGRFPRVSHLKLSLHERTAMPANLAIGDFYTGGSNEIAVSAVAPNHVQILSATTNELREVARLDVPSVGGPRVFAGHFRHDAGADLLVFHQKPARLQWATDLVFAKGDLDLVPTVKPARVGSRTRAVRRAVEQEKFEGTYDARVVSSCPAQLSGEWTIIEEGLFADFVTVPGLRVEAAVVDGVIQARFFLAEGPRTRTFEGPLEAVGNVLKGRFFEYDTPCGGFWATHDIELKRADKR